MLSCNFVRSHLVQAVVVGSMVRPSIHALIRRSLSPGLSHGYYWSHPPWGSNDNYGIAMAMAKEHVRPAYFQALQNPPRAQLALLWKQFEWRRTGTRRGQVWDVLTQLRGQDQGIEFLFLFNQRNKWKLHHICVIRSCCMPKIKVSELLTKSKVGLAEEWGLSGTVTFATVWNAVSWF